MQWFRLIVNAKLQSGVKSDHEDSALMKLSDNQEQTGSQPSQAKVLTGEETCAKRKSTSPCLLAIPSFDLIAGLNNRHLNYNRGICLR